MDSNKDSYNLSLQLAQNEFDLDSCDTKSFLHKHPPARANRLCAGPSRKRNFFLAPTISILVLFHISVDLYLA